MSPDPSTFLERYDYQTVVALKARLRQRDAQLWAILRTYGPLRVAGDLVEAYDARDVLIAIQDVPTRDWIFTVHAEGLRGRHGR